MHILQIAQRPSARLELLLYNRSMRIKISFMIVTVLFQSACSMFGIRSEETPAFEVLAKDDNKEVRSYSSYIVAKTVVEGDYRSAQRQGFKILASYIFGENETKQNISMTAPVVQEQGSRSEKISMTAPVSQEPQEGGWVMTFMMPSKYSLETLPKPKDPRILLEQVPAKTIASVRFSGGRGEKKNAEKAEELRKWIELQRVYKIIKGPSSAGYDPPWTIPWFRRNEVHFEVAPLSR